MNNNQIILNRLSQYLNFCEKSIDDSQIKAVTACGVSIKEAYDALKEIVGLSVNTDLSEEIFSRFCVGK